ncbi:MAG: energy-coupling factor transporter transmembrane component T [bacterium]
MLTLTSPYQTWAHHLPAAAKMAALAAWTVLLFHLATLLPLALTAAATLALPLSCGASFAVVSARMLRPLWPFILILALWHLWTRDLATGSVILLRLITAVTAANFVTMTTRLSDMIRVLARIAGPLALIGLPPKTFALAVALVIRFLPVMLQRMTQIRESFRARSLRRPGWRLFIPALLAALDDAECVAEALRARGGAG